MAMREHKPAAAVQARKGLPALLSLRSVSLCPPTHPPYPPRLKPAARQREGRADSPPSNRPRAPVRRRLSPPYSSGVRLQSPSEACHHGPPGGVRRVRRGGPPQPPAVGAPARRSASPAAPSPASHRPLRISVSIRIKPASCAVAVRLLLSVCFRRSQRRCGSTRPVRVCSCRGALLSRRSRLSGQASGACGAPPPAEPPSPFSFSARFCSHPLFCGWLNECVFGCAAAQGGGEGGRGGESVRGARARGGARAGQGREQRGW